MNYARKLAGLPKKAEHNRRSVLHLCLTVGAQQPDWCIDRLGNHALNLVHITYTR